MRGRRIAALCLTLSVGCGGDPVQVPVGISFAAGVASAEVVRIEIAVIDGTCADQPVATGAEPIRVTSRFEAVRDGPVPMPAVSDPLTGSTVVLYARAFSATCGVVGARCLEADLGDGRIEVEIQPLDDPGRVDCTCVDCCIDGRCDPGGGCGDATVRLEECDDGNEVDGDGCSAACRVEPGYSCAGEPSDCGRRIWITEDAMDVRVFEMFGMPSEAGDYEIVIGLGVTIGASSTVVAGLTTGSFLAGSTLTIVNRGTIQGAGGDGGEGVPGGAGSAGGDGGAAILVQTPTTIDNELGYIWGGGGGGGAGGGGLFEMICSGDITRRSPGQSGGGGAGVVSGAQSGGTPATATEGGISEPGNFFSGTGGTGGAPGEPGGPGGMGGRTVNGMVGCEMHPGAGGGMGGEPGPAIRGFGFVTVDETSTSTMGNVRGAFVD